MPVKSSEVLIIGAGIGGIKAACDLSELGFDVHLVESAPNIGGKLQQHDRWFPTDDCTMCQSLPYLAVQGAQERCLRRVLAFPGVAIHAYSELESLKGSWGNFKAKVRAKSRLIKPELCNECGKCAEVCPVQVKDSFQGELAVRKAAYTLYPGAFPNTYTIDAEACTRCGECVKACPTGAVDLDLPDETLDLSVGAVILAPGFEEFNPAQLPNYGYGRMGNVVTSTQFERITAGGGITPGRLTRPSDGEVPQSVAFITCVGSRDTERPYCSYACCMYTLKEAILAKELHPDMDTCVFYMDMRAFGKEWWKYYLKAKSLGVSFVRCRIASVEQDSGDNLKINYEDESGEYLSRIFGIVVLAAGQVQPTSSRNLAEAAGVKTDGWGFCQTGEFHPVQTDKTGVFAAGSFAGPADISATVTQAQAAALEAASLLWDLRRPSQEPPELRKLDNPKSAILVAGEEADKLAEMISTRCRPDYLEALAGGCPHTILAAVCARLRELGDVDRAVIAAPLSWSWEALLAQQLEMLGFAANKVEVLDTRSTDPKAGARMAQAALSRLSYATEAGRETAEIAPSALVLGGGVTAMTASQALSALGFKVHLVNSEQNFGGQAEKIHTTESGENVDKYVASLLKHLKKDDNIRKYTSSSLQTIAGTAGRFLSVLTTPDGPVEIAHGAVIVATGAAEYDFSGNGYPDGVISQSELEAKLLKGKLKPSSVVMIQCVGTLNNDRPYCSRSCCAKAVKNALALKEASPQTEVFVLCKEVMTYGLHELAYKEARDRGVIFLRYEDERPPAIAKDGKKFRVRVHDPLLEEEVELPADLVVLSTGTVSTDSAQLAKALGMKLDEFGFFKEANPKFRPVETDRAGMFICGLAQGPQSMDEAITQAKAAACRAAAILARRNLHSSALTSTVANRWCVGCELCITVCPVHARVIDAQRKKAKVYSELCVACGACATVCPSSAARSTAANDRQILATIETLSCE